MTIAFDPMAPFDAVLLATYGGPDGPNAVVPFMRNATKGKGIPDERLAEVGLTTNDWRSLANHCTKS